MKTSEKLRIYARDLREAHRTVDMSLSGELQSVAMISDALLNEICDRLDEAADELELPK